MSELQASILPEKQVFVLDQNGYYSVTSTVVDKNNSKEPGFTQSSSGKPFIGSKRVKVEFDVQNGIRSVYSVNKERFKETFQIIVALMDNVNKDAEIERILSENTDFLNQYHGILSKKQVIVKLCRDFLLYVSAISIKDPNMVDVYVSKIAYYDLVNKYIPNTESSAFFYKRKEPITFLQGKVHPFKIYLVIDGTDINIVAIYRYERSNRNKRPININGTEYFTETITLPDFDRENTLILINYKEEIEFYLSHSAFIKLVETDPSEKDKYEDEPYVFYKRKKEHELLEEKGSAISSHLKTDAEYGELNESNIYDEFEYEGDYKKDPEWLAINRYISINNNGLQKERVFEMTYFEGSRKSPTKTHWRVFDSIEAYKDFMEKESKKGKKEKKIQPPLQSPVIREELPPSRTREPESKKKDIEFLIKKRVTELESDVDTLFELGNVKTTIPMGYFEIGKTSKVIKCFMAILKNAINQGILKKKNNRKIVKVTKDVNESNDTIFDIKIDPELVDEIKKLEWANRNKLDSIIDEEISKYRNNPSGNFTSAYLKTLYSEGGSKKNRQVPKNLTKKAY